MLQRCVGRGNKIVPGLSLGRKTLKPLKQTGTVRLGAGSSAWYAASCKGCWLKNVRFARAFAQWPRYTGRPRVQIPPCPPKQSRAVVCDDDRGFGGVCSDSGFCRVCSMRERYQESCGV